MCCDYFYYIKCKTIHNSYIYHWIKWASSWDYNAYHIGDQWRLRRACASAQSHQSLRCSHTWSMKVDGQPIFRHLAPVDGCACVVFDEWVYGGRKVPWLKWKPDEVLRVFTARTWQSFWVKPTKYVGQKQKIYRANHLNLAISKHGSFCHSRSEVWSH